VYIYQAFRGRLNFFAKFFKPFQHVWLFFEVLKTFYCIRIFYSFVTFSECFETIVHRQTNEETDDSDFIICLIISG